jgi:hypothetical protein
MASKNEKLAMTPKLENREVRLIELLGLLNDVRKPVMTAIQDNSATLSFPDLRKSLREAYFALDGERSDLTRNTDIGNRRMLPYLLVHYGAHNLQKLALEALEAADSPENALKLLDRSRELTQIIERHFFGQRPPDDVANVIDIATRKSQRNTRAAKP